VTRPRERAEALWFLLEDEGAEVLAVPLLELIPPDDVRPLRAAAEQLHRYRWVMFASPSGVHGFLEVVREAGTLDRLKRVKLAAVGTATAFALESHGLIVSAQADKPTGLGLFEAVRADLQAGDEVLLPAAQDGRRELEESLLDAGAHVTRVAAYQSVSQPIPGDVLEGLRANPPQAALFASPRTLDAFFTAAPDDAARILETAHVVAIGPTTAAALQARGVSVAAVAENPSAEGLVDATIRAVRGVVS
jgi:uroporphyrinogen-III synthase